MTFLHRIVVSTVAALASLAALASYASANDRDLRASPIPAAACAEYRKADVLTEDRWMAGFFRITGEGRWLSLRCALPLNNIDLSGTTNHAHMTKLRIQYRDSDGPGGGACVVVGVGRTFVDSTGKMTEKSICFWNSNAHGTGSTKAAKSTRPCVHDFVPGSFYFVDVFMSTLAGQTAEFLGIDFPE